MSHDPRVDTPDIGVPRVPPLTGPARVSGLIERRRLHLEPGFLQSIGKNTEMTPIKAQQHSTVRLQQAVVLGGQFGGISDVNLVRGNDGTYITQT